MSDLLPCPFCGDVDHLEVQHLEGTILYPAYRVACDNCGAACGYRERGQHIEEWNDRALPSVQPHVNETPKSEHDEQVMLTPATKGGAA